MSEFFIRRPIVAIVISIFIVIVGVFVLTGLPVEQYPALAPPTVRIEATYPGASAVVVEQSVATPIEQQVNGVDGSIYLKSLNTSDGRMLLEVFFEVGMDTDTASVLIQNRVSQAQARLPQEVLQQGVTVRKVNPSILLAASIFSPNGTYDGLFLNNYATINVRDAILRVPGVSQVNLGGSEYGMRIWLDPSRLAKLRLTPADVVAAIREQNLQAPSGQVGAPPSPSGQQFTYTVQAPGRLVTPEEFAEIIVGSSARGEIVRIKDVGRVELGSESYRSFGRMNGKPAAVLAVYLLPGANQIEAAEGIYRTLEEVKRYFPPDVDYKVVYDTTPAVEASLEEIYVTLFQAVLLVALVVLVFLQNFRATLIPLLTIPVSLIGTFIVFPVFGFSLNTLTLFALVLAIGIVVDDAIVVVEAVTHHIERGLAPKEATLQAMREVSGPVVGIGLVLTSVFIPVALLGGLTGRLYQQFALTIAIAVLLSVFNALSLSPALAAMILRPASRSRGPLGRFFAVFNRGFDATTTGYVRFSRLFVRRAVLCVVALVVAVIGTGLLGRAIPAGFIPDEDQGLFLINVQLPPASSLERTDAVLRRIESILARTEGIDAYNTVGGLGILTNSFNGNYGSLFVRLKPWEERDSPELHVKAITARVGAELARIPEAIAFPFLPPSIPGFSAAGGFNFVLQDRSGTLSFDELGVETVRFIAEARKHPALAQSALFTAFDPATPQIGVVLDREKARTLGVPVNDVFTALQAALGGAYVNDFNRFGRLYRVYVQADAGARQTAEDIGKLFVRSRTTGDMVPLSTLVSVDRTQGAELSVRFNLFRSVELAGSPSPGYTSGQAVAALEEVASRVLPSEMGYAFAGFSYQERTAPSPVPTFVLAVVFVFLLLAALYESWRLPWAVLLATPLVVLGAFAGVWARGLDNNVFVQVGLVMLIGLAAKNAILIVEFAKAKREEGSDVEQAALEAARLRFRPILMTAFAFITGCIPLMLATGAGAGARSVMGTAVVFGMLVATGVGVFLVPGLFAMVKRLGRRVAKSARVAPPPAPVALATGEER